MDNDMWGGTGVTYDYGFRVYDSRIAKFLSVDPLTGSYPWYTPYQFAGNTPIVAIDLDGAEPLWSQTTFNEGLKTSLNKLYSADEAERQFNNYQKGAAHGALAGIGLSAIGVMTASEISLIASTSWAKLPFFTSLTAGGSAYVTSALSQKPIKHAIGGGADFIGQFGINFFSNRRSYGFLSNVKQSFLDVNYTSVTLSTANPTNLFRTLAINGFISNYAKFDFNNGFTTGSFDNILTGMALEITFGIGTGKTDGGALSLADRAKFLNETNELLKNNANFNTKLYDPTSNTLSISRPANNFDQLIKNNKMWDRTLRNLDFGISTIGQAIKSGTSTSINTNMGQGLNTP